jgi:hypothetical protein
MKAKFTLSFLIILVLSIPFFSCSKEELVPNLEGSLVGFVYTFDEFANLLNDHSNVQVTALGLDHYTTRTDIEGRFEFKGLPAGTYELHFEKEGFGTLKQFGIQHLGGEPTTLGLSFSGSTNSEAFFIYQMPTAEILSLSIDQDTISGDFSFTGYQPEIFSLRVYYSNVEGFDVSEARFVSDVYLWKMNGIYKGKIYDLNKHFQSGEEVFYKACFYNTREAITSFDNRVIGGIDSYFDYSINTTIYPNLGNESLQYSFMHEE